MKKGILFLLIILIGAFAVRLYRFDAPVADWHSWRQVDTSSVSRNFVKEGFDLLRPKFGDLSIAVSLKDNPKGYRFVEFPIYNSAQAGLFKLFGKFTLEEWGRIVTIFSSLVSIVFLYLLMEKYINARAGLFAALFLAFIPYNIYYSRTILPDQSMVAAILAGTYFFSNWIDISEKRKAKSDKQRLAEYIFFILAIILTATALLLKPYALFFMLPMAYLTWNRFGLSLFKKWQLYLFFILSVIPF